MSFRFKQFEVNDARCAMKVGTDGVLLGAWADTTGAEEITDLGAGSGLLSLMAAQRCGARITAVEIDGDAVADCADNFAHSPWAERLTVVHANVLDYSPERTPDLVISNPPFFTEELQSPDPARAGARHAGSLSPLTAICWAAEHLSADGSIAIVLPTDDVDAAIYKAEILHLKEQRRLDVSAREGQSPIRSLMQFGRRDRCPQRSHLAIRRHDGTFTDQFVALTTDFYLNF